MDNKDNKEKEVKSVHELENLRREYRKQNIYEKINKMKKNTEKESLKNLKVDQKNFEPKKENKKLDIKIDQKDYTKDEDKKINKKENKSEVKTKGKTQTQNKTKKSKVKNKKEKLRTPKEWKKRRIWKSILILFLTVFIVFFSYFVYIFLLNGGGLKGIVSATLWHNPKKVENLKPFNILILGTNENNTDTIIVASYNPKTQEASMLSIPRDTFIGNNVNTASTAEKINAVYFNHGVNYLKKKIENMTGLEIPYYAILTTDNISNLMKLVGEVEFDVPIDMCYFDATQNLDIQLKKGLQKIDSQKAEMLLRFRHNYDGTTYPASYGMEDHGRMRTQREFIKAVAHKLIKEFDMSKIYELVSNANAYVETNLKFHDYRDYIPYIVEFNSDDIKMGKVNGRGVLARYFFFVPDYRDLDKTIFDLFIFSDDERKNSPANFRVKRNVNQITTVTPKKEAPKVPVTPTVQEEPQKPNKPEKPEVPETPKKPQKPEEKKPKEPEKPKDPEVKKPGVKKGSSN